MLAVVLYYQKKNSRRIQREFGPTKTNHKYQSIRGLDDNYSNKKKRGEGAAGGRKVAGAGSEGLQRHSSPVAPSVPSSEASHSVSVPTNPLSNASSYADKPSVPAGPADPVAPVGPVMVEDTEVFQTEPVHTQVFPSTVKVSFTDGESGKSIGISYSHSRLMASQKQLQTAFYTCQNPKSHMFQKLKKGTFH